MFYFSFVCFLAGVGIAVIGLVATHQPWSLLGVILELMCGSFATALFVAVMQTARLRKVRKFFDLMSRPMIQEEIRRELETLAKNTEDCSQAVIYLQSLGLKGQGLEGFNIQDPKGATTAFERENRVLQYHFQHSHRQFYSAYDLVCEMAGFIPELSFLNPGKRSFKAHLPEKPTK